MRIAALAFLSTVLLAGSVGAQTSEPTVAIAGFTYLPGQDGIAGRARGTVPILLTVREGEPVTATNLDPVPHTITSTSPGFFESGSIAAAGATKIVDTTSLPPGEYPFLCRFHSFMYGVLRVEPADAGSDGD